MVTYPAWTSGQRITAAGLNSMLPMEAFKNADTSRASTTTIASDPDLTLSVVSGGIYRLTGALFYGARSDTDMKLGWSAPASSTLSWHGHCQATTATGTTGSAIYDVQSLSTVTYAPGGAAADNTTLMVVVLHGLLRAGGNGTFVLQWAQNTSNATATILKADSHITLTRVS